MSEPKIVVIGPGAIGGALAGALLDAGRRPVIAARTPFDRLEVTVGEAVVAADVEVVCEPSRLAAADVVVLATKTTQTEGAAEALAATCVPGTLVVIAQNGVRHRENVRPFVDDRAELVPVVLNLPVRRDAPGRITVGGRTELTFERSAAADRIADLFAGSFLRVTLTDDWPTALWTKLLINAAFGAVGVLTGRDSSVMTDPGGYEVTRALMSEILPVARAEGATLADDLPDRILSNAIKTVSGHRSSITTDRLNGERTEWWDRNKIVGVLGRAHGIATPLNDLVTELIRLGEPECEPQ